MSLKSKLRTAKNDPEEILPWLRKQPKRPLRRLEYEHATYNLPEQKALLDRLREQDDWCLIVLDACRYDALKEYTSLFNGEIQPVHSAAHDTFDYVRLCWPDGYNLPYVSGATPINGTRRVYDNDHIESLYGGYIPMYHLEIIDVWHFGWDGSLGTCPPWAVTDAALEHSERTNMVAHYFQPHAPYIGEHQLLGHHDNENAHPHQGTPIDEPIWKAVRNGEISDEVLKAAYLSNLEAALTDVCRLIANTDFEKYVLMGDHGESLGEWGVYTHPRVDHAKIRTVPWLECSGLTVRGKSFAGNGGSGDRVGTDMSVEERLSALGYSE